ncbi:MAG TPA: hypothetical protein VFK03_03150, partial [Candidatus Saccharimonadales bacterium]|nr:hypothetical protein [Candidatus Saccharimonadales bacterium]
YSANWGGGDWNNEKKYINFWDHLDFIGISAYWPVANSDNYSMDELISRWSQIDNNEIKPLHDQWGKQIVFTEVGYRSAYQSLSNPPIWQTGSSPNMQQQSDGYMALFQYWSGKSYFGGISFWNWSSDPNAGGTGDTGYTPQHKPAQQIISNNFVGGGGGPTPTPPPPASGQFSATAAASPSNLSTGQGTTITASVTDNGNSASNLVVDIEAFNQSGQKVFQKFFGGESFSNGQTKTYSAGWTPNASGAYRVTVGVFAGDWSSNYYWNNTAASISVSGNGTPTPTPTPTNTPTPTPTTTPTPGGIDIWWPTNGVHVAGTQPFKAMLKNLDVSQYDMYWQVDNGQLNKMYDSQTDWPHKEAIVDLSGWT